MCFNGILPCAMQNEDQKIFYDIVMLYYKNSIC